MKEEQKGEAPRARRPDRPPGPPMVIPAQIRRVNNLIQRRQNQLARANGVDDVTPMHGWLLSYLERNRDTDVYQRDIEREFSITRSTVTNILQLMEKKGYIRRESVPQDARLKRLVLTEAGVQVHHAIMCSLRETEAYITGLLTPEENEEMLRLLTKLREGLEE